jgi:MerR family transcriptional regulator, thiopeptide resistance regulator
MTEDRAAVWRIGELAEVTGLTVRALHHYDRIGLLTPSQRTDGGHRLYTAADAERLYRIVALRGLGLPLDRIGDCLADNIDPRAIVAEQLEMLTDQLTAGERLRVTLTELLDGLNRHEKPTGQQLLDLVQRTADVDRLVSRYLSEEQMNRLAARHAALGKEAVTLVRVELPELYRRAYAELRAGTDPADPVVRAIAERIDAISARLSGGTPESGQGVRKMWAEHGEELNPGHGIPWADIVEYLDKARNA